MTTLFLVVPDGLRCGASLLAAWAHSLGAPFTEESDPAADADHWNPAGYYADPEGMRLLPALYARIVPIPQLLPPGPERSLAEIDLGLYLARRAGLHPTGFGLKDHRLTHTAARVAALYAAGPVAVLHPSRADQPEQSALVRCAASWAARMTQQLNLPGAGDPDFAGHKNEPAARAFLQAHINAARQFLAGFTGPKFDADFDALFDDTAGQVGRLADFLTANGTPPATPTQKAAAAALVRPEYRRF
jgi:hypothetical protein